MFICKNFLQKMYRGFLSGFQELLFTRFFLLILTLRTEPESRVRSIKIRFRESSGFNRETDITCAKQLKNREITCPGSEKTRKLAKESFTKTSRNIVFPLYKRTFLEKDEMRSRTLKKEQTVQSVPDGDLFFLSFSID